MFVDEPLHLVDVAVDDDVQPLVDGGVGFDFGGGELFGHLFVREGLGGRVRGGGRAHAGRGSGPMGRWLEEGGRREGSDSVEGWLWCWWNGIGGAWWFCLGTLESTHVTDVFGLCGCTCMSFIQYCDFARWIKSVVCTFRREGSVLLHLIHIRPDLPVLEFQ